MGLFIRKFRNQIYVVKSSGRHSTIYELSSFPVRKAVWRACTRTPFTFIRRRSAAPGLLRDHKGLIDIDIPMASSIERKTQKVEHNYKDRSHLVESDHGGDTKPANASDRHFPVKLHYMLSELEQDGLDHIVSWQPHGRCFVVHKQEGKGTRNNGSVCQSVVKATTRWTCLAPTPQTHTGHNWYPTQYSDN